MRVILNGCCTNSKGRKKGWVLCAGGSGLYTGNYGNTGSQFLSGPQRTNARGPSQGQMNNLLAMPPLEDENSNAGSQHTAGPQRTNAGCQMQNLSVSLWAIPPLEDEFDNIVEPEEPERTVEVIDDYISRKFMSVFVSIQATLRLVSRAAYMTPRPHRLCYASCDGNNETFSICLLCFCCMLCCVCEHLADNSGFHLYT